MGQVNSYPDITSLENTDLVLAWEASPGRVVNITLTALRDFLNSGAISTVDDTDLTVSRALVSNGSGKIAVSTVTATELGYLTGLTSAAQTQLDSASKGPVNLLRNSNFEIWDKGISFNNVSTPQNNDGNYLLPGWCLLSDGNNSVSVTQATTTPPDGSRYYLKSLVQLSNKQFGYIQILEAINAIGLRGKTVSLSAKIRNVGSTISSIKLGILAWGGTADSPTRDVVSTWGATPTYVTNWTAVNTPVSEVLTASFQTFKVEAVALGTSHTNLAIFIFTDDATLTTPDELHISQVQLEIGSKATEYKPFDTSVEKQRCQRSYLRLGGDASGNGPAISAYCGAASDKAKTWMPFPTEMRAIPTPTVNGTWAVSGGTGPTVENCSAQGFSLTGTKTSAAGILTIAPNSTDDYIEFDKEL